MHHGSMGGRLTVVMLATGLAAAGACAKPVAPPRRSPTNDWAGVPVDCESPPPRFPESSEPCAVAGDPGDHERASCVPARSRGPLIASDSALGIRVYRACERTVDNARQSSRQLDRRHVMVERTGTELASRESLAGVLLRLKNSPQIFPMGVAQVQSAYYGECPDTGGPDPGSRESCLVVNLTSNDVDLPAVMRAFAELFEDTPDVCIRTVVGFGAVECTSPL